MIFECEACGHEQSWRPAGTGGCERCDTGNLAPVAAHPGSQGSR